MDHFTTQGVAAATPGPGRGKSAPGQTDDRHWKALTERANHAYAGGDPALARTLYAEALVEAERLFEAAHSKADGLPAPVIYNISCHNLAEIALESGDSDAAHGFYRQAYDRLLGSARSPATPLKLRIACIQHLKHALAVLVRHMQAHDAPRESLELTIGQAQDVAFSVFQVAQHAQQAGQDCAHCPISFS